MPEFRVNVGGTLRKITAIHANVSGTMRECAEMHINTDAAVRLVFQSMQPAPAIPSIPIRTARTDNSLTLETTPNSEGGTPTLYRWRYSTNVFVTGADPFVTSDGPTVTITGLIAGQNYWIDVRAENEAGESDYTGNLSTFTSDTGIPAPTNLAYTDGNDQMRTGDTADDYYAEFQHQLSNSNLSSGLTNPVTSYDNSAGTTHQSENEPDTPNNGVTRLYFRARYRTGPNGTGGAGPWSTIFRGSTTAASTSAPTPALLSGRLRSRDCT